MNTPQKRIDWPDRDAPEFVDVPYWRVAGSWGTFGFVVGFVACLLYLTTCEARAGGQMEPEIPDCSDLYGADFEACAAYVGELLMEQQMEQEQEQFALPPDFATPNQPTTIVLDGGDGGSSVAEWGALATGVAALIGALAALRARRHRAPD